MSGFRLPHAMLLIGALLAFAGNSLLNRAALATQSIDPGIFAAVRLISGAVVLIAFGLASRINIRPVLKDAPTMAALFVYAVAFSQAYVSMGAATGSMVLFTAVQLTMIGISLLRGARLTGLQAVGLLVALGGLAWLLSPGIVRPPMGAAALMALAGAAWGIYSVLGRGSRQPVAHTARNFIGAAMLSLPMLAWPALTYLPMHITPAGFWLAVASGAVTSAMGYVMWYAVLPLLTPIWAASLQLLVPVITGFASVVWLQEAPTTQLVGGAVLILSGIVLTFRRPERQI